LHGYFAGTRVVNECHQGWYAVRGAKVPPRHNQALIRAFRNRNNRMTEFSIIAVFFVGLLGGVHCLGMCGSIVGILTGQLPKDGARWPFHLAYNSGRIASYTVAGILVGAIGQAGLLLRDVVPVQHLLFALSSLMLVALGLYLAGIWNMVRRIEQAGSVLWQRIQPLTRLVFPITSPLRALLLGMLWGWLPCGLVFWERCRRWVQSPRVQLLAGLIVMAFGVYGLVKVGYVFAVHGWTGSCHVDA